MDLMTRDEIKIADEQAKIVDPTGYMGRRRAEMTYLRHERRWSLQRIGDRYGISRERVRQIIGNTGKGIIETSSDILTPEFLASVDDLTNDQVAEAIGYSNATISKYRSGRRHAIKPGNQTVNVGLEMEEVAAKMLQENGIAYQFMGYGHPFDILLDNSKRVDVKSSGSNGKTNPKIKSPQYKFRVQLGDKRNDADFYLCITTDTLDAFVIPSSQVPTTTEQIQMCWPTTRPAMSKYSQYHNRWDLLK
jgi:transcriptional regulator with XRE-family HTH domain